MIIYNMSILSISTNKDLGLEWCEEEVNHR